MLGTKILEEKTSKYNKNIKVVKTWGMGTYIQVNGLTQSGGIVESIWRSTLKRIEKEEIENCLILGLGGGTVVKVIQKIWPHAKITGVEIDEVMVELGKKYLGLKDVDVVITNAATFRQDKKYDLVIVDLYTGDEYPKQFEKENFLKSLTKNKLVIFNRLYYKYKKEEADKFQKKLEKTFSRVITIKPVANIMFVCYA